MENKTLGGPDSQNEKEPSLQLLYSPSPVHNKSNLTALIDSAYITKSSFIWLAWYNSIIQNSAEFIHWLQKPAWLTA